jgi:hypothetical protein
MKTGLLKVKVRQARKLTMFPDRNKDIETTESPFVIFVLGVSSGWRPTHSLAGRVSGILARLVILN